MIYIKFDKGTGSNTLQLNLLVEDEDKNLIDVTEENLSKVDLVGAVVFEMIANNVDGIMDKIMAKVTGIIKNETET